MIQMGVDEFVAYIRRNHLACSRIVDDYVAETGKLFYFYEDIDAVYQRQIEESVSRKSVHSQSELLPHGKRRVSTGGGNSRTINGLKYGHKYM